MKRFLYSLAVAAGVLPFASADEPKPKPAPPAETVKKRLGVYFAETAPLINYYGRAGKLLEVNGEGEVGEVGKRVVAALHGR